MERPQPSGACGALAGLADVIDRHISDYQAELAASRGAQAALQAALDRLQSELAAAEAAAPSRAAPGAPMLRLANLRERLHRLDRKAAEVEHRVEGMRGQLARGATGTGGSSG